MKHLFYATLFLGCLTLSSCSKDSLSPEVDGIHRAKGETHVVKLSLDAGFTSFDKQALPDVTSSAFRALERQDLQFEIRDGNNKFIVGDNGQKTNMPSKRGHIDTEDLKGKAAGLKFFVQVRTKEGHILVGSLYKAWEYKSRNTNDWRLNGDDISLTGINPGSEDLQIRIVVGGNLDAEHKKIVIDQPEWQELDLSQTNKVTLPVPFASDWIDLSYDTAKQLYTTVDDEKITLKPLGTLLITTVRSSMQDKTASLTGIRYVTNALAFQGEFSLIGSDNIPFKAKGDSPM